MKVLTYIIFSLLLLTTVSCRKDGVLRSGAAKLEFSQDSVLFDTVFTTIGSSTRQLLIRNTHDQKLVISSIRLEGGSTSQFIVNVDGVRGTTFSDIEIAANDSMYVFVQVNVNPVNLNSPLIISDALHFETNGNHQVVQLEAWGQDAYYHRPTDAIKFSDGSYLAYSLISSTKEVDTIWKKDKPHVIYGYLVVDSLQKLTVMPGVRIYLNYKAGLWVYKGGQIKILGQKGNEVIFQGARREKEYTDEPGQWDRIWINEGSDNNEINYAIIKNGFIGVQAEILGNVIGGPGKLKLTNTRIQNMSMWGVYGFGYNITAGNNVISNCKEHAVNIMLGGEYKFIHCTFANFWSKDSREKACINLSNYTSSGQTLPITAHFGNSIIDGRLQNEINLDLKGADSLQKITFSNSYLKTTLDLSNAARFINVRSGASLKYKDIALYDFAPAAADTVIKGFNNQKARSDAIQFQADLNQKNRILLAPTAGAYEF